VYLCWGVLEYRFAGAFFDDLAFVHDGDAAAEVLDDGMSWEMKR